VRIVAAILWKDLVSEWRSRDRLVAMGLFSILTVVVLYFALPGGREQAAEQPGLLWVAFVFAAMLGLNRSFAVELENDALSALALAPEDRGAIFLGKALATFVLTVAVQAVTAAVFALAFGLDWSDRIPGLAAVIALGTAGISAVGTLLSAMAVRSRFRDLLLPILLPPFLFPILAGCVRATQAVASGAPAPFDALQLLIVIDGIYLVIAYLSFEYILDE